MSNSDIVQKLSEGYKVNQIADEAGINRRTLEERVILIKKTCGAKTLAHIVAKYYKLKLIEVE